MTEDEVSGNPTPAEQKARDAKCDILGHRWQVVTEGGESVLHCANSCTTSGKYRLVPREWRGGVMRYPADVPVHRPSVGAMALASGWRQASPVRFYVYRGMGEDQYPGYELPEPKPEPEPKPKPEVETTEERHKRYARIKGGSHMRRIAKYQAEREAAQAAYDAVPLAPVIPLFPNGLPPVPTEPEPEPPVAPPTPAPQVRPAPGWRPSAGVDIDAWLADLEDS